MPAKDKYHDVVIRALQKEGGVIAQQQFPLELENRHLWIDLYAKHPTKGTIVVEVKLFENMDSPISYLQNTLGQYVMYRAIIEEVTQTLPLYLAVSTTGYRGIWSEDIGQLVIRKIPVKLLVFDVSTESVLQWIE